MLSSIIQASVSQRVHRIQFDVYKDEIHRTYKFSVEDGRSFYEPAQRINGISPNDYDFLTIDHKPVNLLDTITRDGSYLLYFKEKDVSNLIEDETLEKTENTGKTGKDDESISEPDDDCIQYTHDDSLLDYSIGQLMETDGCIEEVPTFEEQSLTLEESPIIEEIPGELPAVEDIPHEVPIVQELPTVNELPESQPAVNHQQISTSTIVNPNDLSTDQLIPSESVKFDKKNTAVNKPFVQFILSKLRKLNCFIK